MAHKEHDKHYKKVVENPMLYLEERYHQIDPVEHQLEVHSMRFFRAGAESAAIEVLALIDWAAVRRYNFPSQKTPEMRSTRKNVSALRPKRHWCTSARSCSSGLTRQ